MPFTEQVNPSVEMISSASRLPRGSAVRIVETAVRSTSAEDRSPADDFRAFLLDRTRGRSLRKRFMAWAKWSGISDADAEDAIQTTLFKVHERVNRGLQLPDEGWLFTTAKRFAVALHRKTKKFQGAALEIDHDIPEKPHANVTPEHLGVVVHATEELGDEDHQLLKLHFWDGYSITQISEQLGIHRWTVHQRLVRALVTLRTTLGRSEHDFAEFTE
jgi:RNA polymerase sigma factor (sigma-70 family)